MNYTSDSAITVSYHSSCFGGREKSLNTNNNNSHFVQKKETTSGHWLILKTSKNTFLQYSQLINSTAYSCIRFYSTQNGDFSNLNLISLSLTTFFNGDSTYQSIHHIYIIDCIFQSLDVFTTKTVIYESLYCNTPFDSFIFSNDLDPINIQFEGCDMIMISVLKRNQIFNFFTRLFTSIILTS